MRTERTLPPQNLEAEQGVLGACILDPDALRKAREVVTASEFYRESHGVIFSAMCFLADSGVPCELVSLTDHIQGKGLLETIGGRSYLVDLTISVPTSANVTYHARLIKEKAVRRQIIGICQTTLEAIDDEEIPELFAKLETIRNLRPSYRNRFLSVADVMAGGEETAYLIDGLLPQDALVLLSGPQGHYKTMLALSMADAVSMGKPFLGRPTSQRPVYYIDRENIRATHRNYIRLLGIGESSSIRLWPLYGEIEPLPLPDGAYLGLKDALVFFDSLIRFFPKGSDENASMHVNPVMSFLRGLANQGCTVVVLHHTAKNAESDYRGSTDISAAVDVAFRIHRHGEGSRKLTLRCFKSRFFEEFEMPFEVVQHVRGSLVFDTAPDRDEEDVAAIYDLMQGRTLNQTQIFDMARDSLGLRNKGRLIQLLKAGESRYWERTREGRRVLYSPNLSVQLSGPIRGRDSKTDGGSCSQGQETDRGNEGGKSHKNQELSNRPGDAETVKTDGKCPDVEMCDEAYACSQVARMREHCGGPFVGV